VRSAEFSSEPPIKVYRLYLSGFSKVMVFGMLILFTLFGLLMIVGVFEESPPRFFGVFWLAVVGVLWYRVLTIPHRIEVFPGGRVAFVSLLRQIRILPVEVESIKPASNQIGFFILKHRGGRVLLLGQFDGFHEFLSGLKVSNPHVELRGC
jgi:hypothetical protein